MAETWTRVEVEERLAELVKSAAPGEAATFDLYWELLSPNLEAVLEQGVSVTRGPRGWQVGQAQLFGSAEGDLVQNMMLATIGSWAEAKRLGVTDQNAIAAIVTKFAGSDKQLLPFRRGIQDFVLYQMERGVHPPVSGPSTGNVRTVEVLTRGSPRRLMDRHEADAWIASKEAFDLFLDEDAEVTKVRRQVVSLPPMERNLLARLLSNTGGKLDNRDAELHLWSSRDEIADLNQVYSRLRKALGTEAGSWIRTNRGLDSHSLDPNPTFCLIRPVLPARP